MTQMTKEDLDSILGVISSIENMNEEYAVDISQVNFETNDTSLTAEITVDVSTGAFFAEVS
jgi:hypothetical protein